MVHNADALIARSPAALHTELGEKIVMMSLESGAYCELDPVGATIWRKLEQPQRFGDLCDALVAEYDVQADVCKADVAAFIQQLRDFDAITITAEG